eukprot:CAMPEP_0182418196 /NCGR_PEP_ID=MMETSP1167-20130531/2668_1 /TAXON_ID=2988 /ORGANISM="Mallomonas Sp, Strain CCMP3275" /LENGTH=466 /DNA_ID=CAMNT_0024592271 /DNA_START=567 /DNA_END=1964 /DNA_ORIENTATION=-
MGKYHLHKNMIGKFSKKYPSGRSVFDIAFSTLRHPGNPVKSEFVFSQSPNWSDREPFSGCEHIILTRTGSRESMPNKCVAVAVVAQELVSPQLHSNRMGYQALLTNQYQNDYARHKNLQDELELLMPLYRDRKELVKELRRVLGDPIRSDGTRRTATVMVANEGVMDLVLNFLCSVRASHIDSDGIIVFVGQQEHIVLLENMGVKGIYHESLGSMPSHAAGNYADSTFTRLMWLKVTSVYLSLVAGFDVLFQDADLVWMKDPRPMLQATSHDAVFMDDGARTPRFTPFFANTGFYYLRCNSIVLHLMERVVRGVGEIAFTHSHQATLNRHLLETQGLLNLQINVLSSVDFPSGIMFHHNKSYMKRLSHHQEDPYVFHMCWTNNRHEKVTFFKQIGMWFIPEDRLSCSDGKAMLLSVTHPSMISNIDLKKTSLNLWNRKKGKKNEINREIPSNITIPERCCLVASHW